MPKVSLAILLSFGCSIHCVLFAILSILFPILSIQHSGWVHQFDLLFIWASILMAISIFIHFSYVYHVSIQWLPISALLLGAVLLCASIFSPTPIEYVFQTLGSLLLATSNIYYIKQHKHHQPQGLHSINFNKQS